MTAEKDMGKSVDELRRLGRFVLRTLGSELGLFGSEDAKCSFMQMTNEEQAKIIHKELHKMEDKSCKAPSKHSTTARALVDVLARTTADVESWKARYRLNSAAKTEYIKALQEECAWYEETTSKELTLLRKENVRLLAEHNATAIEAYEANQRLITELAKAESTANAERQNNETRRLQLIAAWQRIKELETQLSRATKNKRAVARNGNKVFKKSSETSS